MSQTTTETQAIPSPTQSPEQGTGEGLDTRTRARPREGAATPGQVVSPVPVSPKTIKGLRLGDRTKVAWKRLGDCSPYSGKPPSIRDRVEYTREGGWMPGDRAPWLEFLGKAYGYLLAIPVTAALYAVSWWIAKPSRVISLVFLYALMYWGA
jgi:hypothetical protein